MSVLPQTNEEISSFVDNSSTIESLRKELDGKDTEIEFLRKKLKSVISENENSKTDIKEVLTELESQKLLEPNLMKILLDLSRKIPRNYQSVSRKGPEKPGLRYCID